METCLQCFEEFIHLSHFVLSLHPSHPSSPNPLDALCSTELKYEYPHLAFNAKLNGAHVYDLYHSKRKIPLGKKRATPPQTILSPVVVHPLRRSPPYSLTAFVSKSSAS